MATKHKTGSANPKVYVALLTQSGTNAPVATVLENTLGSDIVWTYQGIGQYYGTLANAFTLNKTTVILGTAVRGGDPSDIRASIVATTLSVNQIQVSTGDAMTSTREDDGLLNTAIEIRVYP